MSIILDIAGALFVRSAIVTIMLTSTAALNDALYFRTAYKNLQTDLSSTVEVIESDFSKIGYNTGGNRFLLADSVSVSFFADLDDSTITPPDTITYYLSSTVALGVTSNPNDRFLYRRVGNAAAQPLRVGSGVTRFFIRYYNEDGSIETDPSLILSLHVELQMEHGTFSLNGEQDSVRVYPEVSWQRRIFPVNG